MAQYENRGDRQNILLAVELPEDMTGTQDTQHICGKCDGVVNDTGAKCKKPAATCLKWYDAYKGALIALDHIE